MELINRDGERAALRACAEAPPALVVVRGRRRIGKSFLLSRCLAGDRVVSFQADEQDQAGQLTLFAREASRLLPGTPRLRFDTWDEALEFIGSQAKIAPVTLILDELQYIHDAQPAILSIIQRHWDRWDHNGVPVLIVLSGSALTFMESINLDHGNPLFGRASERILLDAMDYRWAARFAGPGFDGEALVRRYAILGGTPQYQVWGGEVSLGELLRRRILRKGSPLYEEPLHLLRGERGVREPGTYFAILHGIGQGATTHGELLNHTRLKPAALSKMLHRLQQLGYVEPRAALEPGGPTNRTIYRIRDNFFRFWFRYVLPNRSRLERGRADEVAEEVEADLDNFMGLAWEDCCRDWAARYAPDELTQAVGELGGWWFRNHQQEIDIVGLGRRERDGYALLGTCKWARSMGDRPLRQLVAYRDRLGKPALRARLVAFARSSFTPQAEEFAAAERIALHVVADLFPPNHGAATAEQNVPR